MQVRTMQWSHNDVWMVTGDHAGYIKYWQSNMNNVKMFQVIISPVKALHLTCRRLTKKQLGESPSAPQMPSLPRAVMTARSAPLLWNSVMSRFPSIIYVVFR